MVDKWPVNRILSEQQQRRNIEYEKYGNDEVENRNTSEMYPFKKGKVPAAE